MPYLIELVLFCLPFAAYYLWVRLNPGVEAGTRFVPLALIGIALAMAGAIWYGLSVSMEPHAVYVPAELGADGTIRPGRAEPRR
jgi:hypothetical protein